MNIEIHEAIDWTVRLVSVCVLIGTIEKLLNHREYRIDGIFSWEWLRHFSGYKTKPRALRVAADFFFRLRVWIPLLVVRGFAALILILCPATSFKSIFLLVLFAVGSLENYRRLLFFPEVPNRFSVPIVGALMLQALVPTQIVTVACIWFIALQACLAYATAGVTKILNKNWRAGEAIFDAANFPHFAGLPGLASFFRRNRLIGKTLSYTTVAVESAFPFVLVVGAPFFWLFLIWGVIMHSTNAFVLRLNNYFWAFIAAYPAIIYLAQL